MFRLDVIQYALGYPRFLTEIALLCGARLIVQAASEFASEKGTMDLIGPTSEREYTDMSQSYRQNGIPAPSPEAHHTVARVLCESWSNTIV